MSNTHNTNEYIKYLICPIDGLNMSKKVGSLICKNNHTFDISREGYVNMLLARKKLPKTVGDNRDMILARSKFLSLGYYGPLVQTINGMVANFLSDSSTSKIDSGIVEVGCGSAYYISELKKI